MSYTTEQMLQMAIDVAKEEMGEEFTGHTVGYTTQASQIKDGLISESFFIVLRAEDGQYMASGSSNLNNGFSQCLEYFQSALREYKQTGFPCER